jgi:hypothetical protein
MAEADGGLKVFISYSRKDSAFAEELLAGLELLGFAAFLDKHDIAAGEDWERRLGRLIESADTVVYVVSPDSVGSERCGWEVARTGEIGKRLLPIVWRNVEEAQVPPALKRLNYIYFDKPHAFAPGLKALAQALRTDLDWVREHTRIGELAQRWHERKRNEALLMRGDDLVAAKAWAARQPKFAPEPTLVMREFIAAGEDAERERVTREDALRAAAQDAEVKRVRAEQEAAEARLDAQRRRSRYLTAGAGVAVLLVAGMGWQAWQLSQGKLRIAELERREAERTAARAERELDRVAATAEPGDRRGGAVSPPAGGASSSPSTASPTVTAPSPGGPLAAPPPSSTRAPTLSPSVARTATLTSAEARKLVSDTAYRTIVDFESDGKRNDPARPASVPFWPGYSSGVVIGLGYDLGYVDLETFMADWGGSLPAEDAKRLAAVVRISGSAAEPLARQLADIRIPWTVAEKVFQERTLTDYVNRTDAALPNFRQLAPDAAGALVSLVYNRGADFRSASEKRIEMSNIRAHMETKEFTRIPAELRAMKRHWTSRWLQERREAEAVLFERGLVAMGLLDKPSGPLPQIGPQQQAVR